MKEYHPDTLSDRPLSEQRQAEEVFKRVQNNFDRIDASR